MSKNNISNVNVIEKNRIFEEYGSCVMSKAEFNHMYNRLVACEKFTKYERNMEILEETGNVDGILELIISSALETNSVNR